MRAACIAVVVVGSFHSARADGPPRIDDAIDRAAAEHKTLLIELSTTWCGPCQRFETQILPDSRVQAALADVMFVRYDAEEAPGTVPAARYDVYSYPTFLAIDKHRVVRFRHEGMSHVDDFIKLIADARAATEDEADVRARLRAKPDDVGVRLAAARWFADRDMTVDALAQYDLIAHDAHSSPAARSEAWCVTARIKRKAQWKRQIVDEKVEVIRRAPDGASAQDLAIATVDSGLSMAEIRSLFAIVFTMQTDADALNELVYVALAAGAKDEALFGAKKLVRIRRDGKSLDALAAYYAAIGDRKRAVDTEDLALSFVMGTPLWGVVAKDKSRFESGARESSEVALVRLKMADLWTRMKSADQLAQRIDDPDKKAEETRRANQWMARWKAEKALEDALRATCEGVAESARLAVARVEVDYQGHIIRPVLLLEETAPAALRTCLLRDLSTRTLPLEESFRRLPLTLTVRFDGLP